MTTNGAGPLLEARNVSKYYGAVVALEDVSLSVRAGEINCLLGDNGAGKSTLIKILSGVHKPDAGTLAKPRVPVKPGCGGPSPCSPAWRSALPARGGAH